MSKPLFNLDKLDKSQYHVKELTSNQQEKLQKLITNVANIAESEKDREKKGDLKTLLNLLQDHELDISFFICCKYGYVEHAQELFELGADPNRKNIHGMNSLDIAIIVAANREESRYDKIITFLLLNEVTISSFVTENISSPRLQHILNSSMKQLREELVELKGREEALLSLHSIHETELKRVKEELNTSMKARVAQAEELGNSRAAAELATAAQEAHKTELAAVKAELAAVLLAVQEAQAAPREAQVDVGAAEKAQVAQEEAHKMELAAVKAELAATLLAFQEAKATQAAAEMAQVAQEEAHKMELAAVKAELAATLLAFQEAKATQAAAEMARAVQEGGYKIELGRLQDELAASEANKELTRIQEMQEAPKEDKAKKGKPKKQDPAKKQDPDYALIEEFARENHSDKPPAAQVGLPLAKKLQQGPKKQQKQ